MRLCEVSVLEDRSKQIFRVNKINAKWLSKCQNLKLLFSFLFLDLLCLPCRNLKKEKKKRKERKTLLDIDFGRVLLVPVSNSCRTWVLGQKCHVRAT